ncbi:hypothetical protein NO1_0579 [Candidatus Termititenax aidoneus]|uniref:Uncharacterized protein n=1 Tax=Termititenax aidoneus TaxID=2218524 RepID=A0A388T9D3_TERA1|nr:hypothetical protein NO1_0579 [Candidatus Termititenax aidoneus]
MVTKKQLENLKPQRFGKEKPPLSHREAVENGKKGSIAAIEKRKEKLILSNIIFEQFIEKVADGKIEVKDKETGIVKKLSWTELLQYAWSDNPNAFIKNYVEITEGKKLKLGGDVRIVKMDKLDIEAL